MVACGTVQSTCSWTLLLESKIKTTVSYQMYYLLFLKENTFTYHWGSSGQCFTCAFLSLWKCLSIHILTVHLGQISMPCLQIPLPLSGQIWSYRTVHIQMQIIFLFLRKSQPSQILKVLNKMEWNATPFMFSCNMIISQQTPNPYYTRLSLTPFQPLVQVFEQSDLPLSSVCLFKNKFCWLYWKQIKFLVC